MKTVEESSGHVIAPRVAAAIPPKLSFIETVAKRAIQRVRTKDWSSASKTVEAVIQSAEEGPARRVAAAMAGVIALSIGFVVLVVKLFG